LRHILSLPLHVPISKKKRFYLNLNNYRNAHFRVLSLAKHRFHDAVKAQILTLPKLGRVHLTYTLYPPTAQRRDTGNVCSIVDKFFSDSLVTLGRLNDDNSTIVLKIEHCYGMVDKSNPRVEVAIETVGETILSPELKKDSLMQITIVEAEIKQAIRDYILSQVPMRDDTEISIDLKATRGEDGYQAIIDIKRATAYSKSTPPSERATSMLQEAALVPTKEDPEVEPIHAQPLGIQETIKKARAGRKPKVTPVMEEPDEEIEDVLEDNNLEMVDPIEEETPASAVISKVPSPFAKLAPVQEDEQVPEIEDDLTTAEAKQPVQAAGPSLFAPPGVCEPAPVPKENVASIFAGLKRTIN